MSTADHHAAAHEVTDLLQLLIRNACVNDATAESGQEVRSADLVEAYLEGPGLCLERYEANTLSSAKLTRCAPTT